MKHRPTTRYVPVRVPSNPPLIALRWAGGQLPTQGWTLPWINRGGCLLRSTTWLHFVFIWFWPYTSGCQSLREPLRRKRSTRLPRICKRAFVSVNSNAISQNSLPWLSITRAGFSGAFIDRMVETKGVRMFSYHWEKSRPIHIIYIPAWLCWQRESQIPWWVSPLFPLDGELNKNRHLAEQQLSEASANDYAEY